ncbi:MAG TPA: hypothetical protein VFF77_01820 [Holophagaceae bacterium]|jgi:hypothetical protein|nr:hypothetical protein [Holophagaceae bacterium]
MRPKAPRTAMTSFALGMGLLILIIQVYLFETVLGSVLDGHRALLGGAFFASLILTIAALVMAFRARSLDS